MVLAHHRVACPSDVYRVCISMLYQQRYYTQIHIKVSMVPCAHEVAQGSNAHLVPQHTLRCAEALLDVLC